MYTNLSDFDLTLYIVTTKPRSNIFYRLGRCSLISQWYLQIYSGKCWSWQLPGIHPPALFPCCTQQLLLRKRASHCRIGLTVDLLSSTTAIPNPRLQLPPATWHHFVALDVEGGQRAQGWGHSNPPARLPQGPRGAPSAVGHLAFLLLTLRRHGELFTPALQQIPSPGMGGGRQGRDAEGCFLKMKSCLECRCVSRGGAGGQQPGTRGDCCGWHCCAPRSSAQGRKHLAPALAKNKGPKCYNKTPLMPHLEIRGQMEVVRGQRCLWLYNSRGSEP